MALRIFRSLDQVPADFGPSALTIGNFDGVHAGHRRILRRVRELAAAGNLRPSVLTFDPHPTRVVAPERAPRLMTTCDERTALMAEEGIEQVLILPFGQETAKLSPERFVSDILVDRLGVRVVAVGDNFRFGHRQAGNIQVLRELGERLGFITEVVPAVTIRGIAVSSSELRRLVGAGDIRRAARLLARPYSLVPRARFFPRRACTSPPPTTSTVRGDGSQ
jgi:riboflavin kinase/FMN adenylyltransferase